MAYTPSSNYLTVRRLWDILSSFKTKIATALGGKSDKSSTVSNVAWSSSKLTKTINGTTTDVVSASTLKSAMSLNNVTNDAQVKRSEMGTASGVATLDANGIINTSQLPSYVDDVLEYSAKSQFPATGETGKIYVDTSTNLTWRWSGTTYVEISPSLALGETSSTAYRGDRGKTAYDHSQLTSGNPHNVTAADVGLGNVNNTSITVSASDGVKDNTNNVTYKYTHPTSSGNKHIPSGGSSGQFLGWDSDGTAKWVSNPNSDTKVTQTKDDSGATAYPLLMAGATDPNGSATTARYDSDVKLTPSTNTISANISGNATTATTATDYNTSSGTIKTALDGKVDFGLSNNTSNIGNDAPAADCISYWGSDNIPNNHIKMVYNQPGAEATLIFSKRSTYGSILKYGYIDKYVYILRNQNGTWKSNAWEKISAGYADSAGTATTATSAAKVAWTAGTASTERPVGFANSANSSSYSQGSDFDGEIVYDKDFTYKPSGSGNGESTLTVKNPKSSSGNEAAVITKADVAGSAIWLDSTATGGSHKRGLWAPASSVSGDSNKWIISNDYVNQRNDSDGWEFIGTSACARYACHEYSTGGGSAYWIKIGRITSSASSGSAGGALTAIISSGFNTAGDDLSAQLIRVSIRSKGQSTNGVTIVGDNVTLGLQNTTVNADVRFAVHTVTDRTTSVNGVYDIYVERKGWHYVAVLQLHNDDVERTYNSDTTKAISDTTNMTIFSPILPYAGSAVSANELRIPYGSGSAYLQIGVSGTGNYLTLGTNMTDGVSVSYASNASTAAVGNLLAVANAAGTGVTQYYMRAIEYTSGGTTYIALTKNDGTSNVRVKSAENADGCDGWKFKVGSLDTATDTIYFIAGS